MIGSKTTKICLIFISSFIFACLCFAQPVSAAYDSVQFTQDTDIYLSGIPLTLVIGSGSKVASMTVYSDYVSFDMESGSTVTITSNDRRPLSNSLDLNTECNSTYSTITLTSDTNQTVTVTPGNTICNNTGNTGVIIPIPESSISTKPIAQIIPQETKLKLPTVTFGKPISQMTREEILAKIAEITQAIEQIKALMPDYQPIQSFSELNIPSSFQFQSNLKKGMTDIAVKYLQMILNQDKDTQLTQTGAGSSGKETTYFGSLTEQAVIKFQEKYRDSILSPWKLTDGTGFVGKTTINKLNSLLNR